MRHVTAAMEDMIRFVERPQLKAGYAALFKESLLVQNRHNFGDGEWRHGWFYDASADQEPQVGEQSNRAVCSTPPLPDGPVAKMFFEAALGVAAGGDTLIAPNSRSPGASKALLGYMSKAANHEVLNIIYKEYPARGKQKLHEVVHAASLRVGPQRVRARLHYTLTTTGSDSIVQAEDMDEPLKLEQQQKLAIVGTEGMANYEKMMKPTEKVILFHWEKRLAVYSELLHHFGFTSITAASCGRLPLLQACVRANVKCLALYRNATHGEILKRDMLAWMFEESLSNPIVPYYLSRAALMEQLGLEPDVVFSQPMIATQRVQTPDPENVSSDADGEQQEGEEEEEEGQDKEGQEEEEEEEKEEEEEEEETGNVLDKDPEPPKKKPKGAAKGAAKEKAKGKGKAAAKDKAKGKAPITAKAKGQAKANMALAKAALALEW